jgi:hypothetical protein
MTTAPDPLSFDHVAARIGRTLSVVAALGTCGAWVLGGWKTGAGFLLGAAISGLNYHWLHKLVASLGGGGHPRYRSVILGFRYLILGGGAYVILRLSPISLTAVLAGLFVLTAAVFVEVIFELVYARKRTLGH